jgi:transcriptional regulator with XRE-family HTH domain|nr:MAG TPA: Cro/C1-type HTH DNA-binding domain protein [Caudoviricetes sp.]
MPQMDYTLLRGRIRDHGMSQKEVAEKIGVSEGQFCQKMTGNFAFRQDEIDRICTLLDIAPAEIGRFFFCAKS